MTVGYEFLGQGLSNIHDRYLTFYNRPLESYWATKTKPHPRYRQVENGRRTFEEQGVDLEFIHPENAAPAKYHQVSEGKWQLKLDQLAEFKQGKRSNSGVSVSGKVDFALSMNIEHEDDRWKLSIDIADKSVVTDYKCSLAQSDCGTMKDYIETKLSTEVFFMGEEIYGHHLPRGLM